MNFFAIINKLAFFFFFLVQSVVFALIGGNPSSRDLFPSSVSARAPTRDCGGVAISTTQILTAAHCVFNESGSLNYNSGSTLAYRYGDDQAMVPRFNFFMNVVVSVSVHPSFLNDIAQTKNVFRTAQKPEVFDLAIIEFIEPHGVPSVTIGALNLGEVILTGGGCVTANGSTNNLLRFGIMRFIEIEGSMGITENDLPQKVTACEGDSGSAVYQEGKLVGIVRGGSEIESDGHAAFSLFTIIDEDWISSIKK
jgi:Trypsin